MRRSLRITRQLWQGGELLRIGEIGLDDLNACLAHRFRRVGAVKQGHGQDTGAGSGGIHAALGKDRHGRADLTAGAEDHNVAFQAL